MKKHIIRIIITGAAIVFVSTVSFTLFGPSYTVRAASAACYVTYTGGVAKLDSCPPPSTGANSVTYFGLGGQPVTPEQDKCYVTALNTANPGSRVFRESSCSALESSVSPPPPSNSPSPGTSIPTPTGPEMDCKVDGDGNLDGGCALIDTLNVILNIVAGGVVLAVIINIIYGGIRYSMSQGNPSDASTAKKRITDAIMAFIMFMLLYVFLQWLIPGGPF